jgi:hypothetical protein
MERFVDLWVGMLRGPIWRLSWCVARTDLEFELNLSYGIDMNIGLGMGAMLEQRTPEEKGRAKLLAMFWGFRDKETHSLTSQLTLKLPPLK